MTAILSSSHQTCVHEILPGRFRHTTITSGQTHKTSVIQIESQLHHIPNFLKLEIFFTKILHIGTAECFVMKISFIENEKILLKFLGLNYHTNYDIISFVLVKMPMIYNVL